MAGAWDINIVGHDVKPASWFLAHPKNFRIHPKAQQDATKGSLNELGWIDEVMVNLRTSPAWGSEQNIQTLLNGHLRITLALREGDDTPVPVKYVDLSPDKEDTALGVIDAITALAFHDKEKLDTHLHDTNPAEPALQQFFSELATKEGITPPDFQPVGIEEQGRLDEKAKVECPECGAIFAPKG